MEKDEVCRFCVAVKIAINYRATKVCLLQLPQNVKDKMMPLGTRFFVVSRFLF